MYLRIYMYMYLYTYIRTYTHTQIHTSTHTHTRTHAHIHSRRKQQQTQVFLNMNNKKHIPSLCAFPCLSPSHTHIAGAAGSGKTR